ncbi:MAG: PKD domain-containing protein, partial [Nitrospirae bacterium]|nr:PKD domain-containing protein [Nitrospirota bacterium]
FPILVGLENGQATVNFSAVVTGGKESDTFTWNFDGVEDQDGAAEASFTYLAAGKYLASVRVTDVECGLIGEDTLPVIVIDPEQEACHPMAQRIADGVNTLYPWQADDLYTCEYIYGIFRGALTGSQVGFGRMWHAYYLAQTIQDLTWEEIRDWHLDGNGWGGLVQLDRFAELLEQYGIRELVDLVVSGEATIGEIRHSIRSVLRYEADFEDALARLGDGMSPGELGRFYKTTQALELDPTQLDGYLESGHSLQELIHAARFAERSNLDWTQVVEAHAAGHSWGEIGQAQRLADGEDWMSVLDTGIRETREQLREEDRTEREQERTDRTAEQLAARYELNAQEVLDLYNGVACEQDWGCVRKALRDPAQSETVSDQDQKTALRLASQYGVSELRREVARRSQLGEESLPIEKSRNS